MEVIIVDDASTDNSIEVIEDFAKKYSAIKLIRNEVNKGPIYSFRRGWENIEGDYFYLASADDKILPGFFEKSMALLEQYPKAGLCAGISILDNGEKQHENPLRPYIADTPSYLSPEKVLDAYIKTNEEIVGNTAIWRREPAIETRGFPMELENILDEFTLLMISLNYGVCFIPEPLAIYNIKATSFSSKYREDPQALEHLLKKAEVLMETTYSNWFPPAFVEFFKRKNRYLYGVGILTKLEQSQVECLQQIEKTLPSQIFLDKIFFKAAQFPIKFQKIICRIFWLIRKGKFSWYKRRWNNIFSSN